MDATEDHFCYFKFIEIINLQYFVLNIYISLTAFRKYVPEITLIARFCNAFNFRI